MENFLKLCQNLHQNYNQLMAIQMTTKTTYQWPQSKDIYPYRPGRFDAPKHWRYNLRSFLNRGSIRRFEQFINQHPFLVNIFNTHWIIVIPLLVVFWINASTLHNVLMLFVITFYFYPKNLPHFLRRYGKNH